MYEVMGVYEGVNVYVCMGLCVYGFMCVWGIYVYVCMGVVDGYTLEKVYIYVYVCVL